MSDAEAREVFRTHVGRLNNAKSLSHITDILLNAGIKSGVCGDRLECPVAQYLSEMTEGRTVMVGPAAVLCGLMPDLGGGEPEYSVYVGVTLSNWMFAFDMLSDGDHVEQQVSRVR